VPLKNTPGSQTIQYQQQQYNEQNYMLHCSSYWQPEWFVDADMDSKGAQVVPLANS
jgi:hypothetical protein